MDEQFQISRNNNNNKYGELGAVQIDIRHCLFMQSILYSPKHFIARYAFSDKTQTLDLMTSNDNRKPQNFINIAEKRLT